MARIELDEETHALVRFAAQAFGVSEAEVVSRAVSRLKTDPQPPPEVDPWTPVDIYGEYEGQRVDGKYLLATRRLTVTSGALADRTFTTPSAAAREVIAALNPARGSVPTNGWRFWRLADTHQRLEVLRQRATAAR